MRKEVQNWTKKHKCPICGKDYFPAPHHIYHDVRENSHIKLVCSYSCMRETERIKAGKGDKRRKRHEPNIKDYHREYRKEWTAEENETIAKMRADGHTYYEIGLVVGCPENNVRSHWTHVMKAEREKQIQKGVDAT